MSFALTTQQVRAQTKTVTRRCGWTFLRPGDRIRAVVKGMGLKKGEKVQPLGVIEVVDVRQEQLARLIVSPAYGQSEVKREGFHGYTRHQFVEMFMRTHHCDVNARVTRIEFKYVGACASCWCPIAGTALNLCGECACEDDSAIW